MGPRKPLADASNTPKKRGQFGGQAKQTPAAARATAVLESLQPYVPFEVPQSAARPPVPHSAARPVVPHSAARPPLRTPLLSARTPQVFTLRHQPALSTAARRQLGLYVEPPPPPAPGSAALEDCDLVSMSPASRGSHAARGRSLALSSVSVTDEEEGRDSSIPPPPPLPDPNTRALVLEGRLRDVEAERDALARQAALATTRRADAGSQTDSHPNFGALLADLGFKKLYLASARAFTSSVPIWSRQRACSQGRVDEIVKAKAEAPHFTGTIACYEFEGVGAPSVACAEPRAIFDGQHRACAAARLLSSPDFEVDGDDLHADFPLLVEVYPVRSEREVKELYLEYNKGENVREIDLPDAVAPDLKKFIDHAVDALANRFGVMFKPSERCRPPHVHRDTLRNALYHARVAERVESGAQLLELLLAANERLAGRPKKSWPAKLGAAYEKAKREKFYLGLDSLAWVETL